MYMELRVLYLSLFGLVDGKLPMIPTGTTNSIIAGTGAQESFVSRYICTYIPDNGPPPLSLVFFLYVR